MSKKTELDALANELFSQLPAAPAPREARPRKAGRERKGARVEPFLVARLVNGLSLQDWQDFAHSHPESGWYALPLPADAAQDSRLADVEPGPEQDFPARLSAPELARALRDEMFMDQLNRELLRLSRTGGSICLMSAAATGMGELRQSQGEKAVAGVENLLREALQGILDACDSLGSLARGRFIALLPGVGQLKARRLAGHVQQAFAEAAAGFFSSRQLSGAEGPECAIGILNVVQDSRLRAGRLLSQAAEVLDTAIAAEKPHFHQVFSNEYWDEATLVQTNEKRFLFFGGEPA